MRIRSKAIGAASVAAAMVGLAAGPASAATEFTNFRVQVLSSNPVGDPPTCQVQALDLKTAGTYSWVEYFNNTQPAVRSIALKASNYTWTICLTPGLDASTDRWGYSQSSSLKPTTGATAKLGSSSVLDTTGTSQWGDTLTLVN
jgi:hypothetical protein